MKTLAADRWRELPMEQRERVHEVLSRLAGEAMCFATIMEGLDRNIHGERIRGQLELASACNTAILLLREVSGD